MRDALRRIASEIDAFARLHGWGPGEYRLLANPNPDWGRIHLILAARAYPSSMGRPWFAVMDYLESRFADEPDLFDSINLTTSTYDQIEQGGLHRLPDVYDDIDDFVAGRRAC